MAVPEKQASAPYSLQKDWYCGIFLGRIQAYPAESDQEILEQLDAGMAGEDDDSTFIDESDGSASEAGYYEMGDGDNEELLRTVLQKVSRYV